MQGGQIVNQIITQLMNSGFKNVLRNIFNSANKEQMAMNMVNAYVKKNPQFAPLWQQAQEMAGAGNAREKTKNFFSERGVDIEQVIDGVAKEIKQ